MNVKRVALAREVCDFRTVDLAAVGFVDEIGVRVGPFSDRGQRGDRGFGNAAIAFGPMFSR